MLPSCDFIDSIHFETSTGSGNVCRSTIRWSNIGGKKILNMHKSRKSKADLRMEIMPEHSKFSCILSNACGHRFTGEALRAWESAGKKTCPKCDSTLQIQDVVLPADEARPYLHVFYGVYRNQPSSSSTGNGHERAARRVNECSVCVASPQPAPGNKVLECAGCGVKVHQLCCGVVDDPPSRWQCSPCKERIDPLPSCVLCSTRGGALQRVKGGGWAHLLCALWLPEVGFEDPNTMSHIRSLDHVNPLRFKLRCSVCKERSGACIQCREPRCTVAFHATCARKARYLRELDESENPRCENPFVAYCQKHLPRPTPPTT